MYYYILSMVPIAFNYGYILLAKVPRLYLLRFFLNWMIFPVMLVLINFFRVKSGKIRPLGSFLVSFFVMLMCYGSVYIMHYATTDIPFEMFSISALFLVNMYFFMPFAVVSAIDIAFAVFRGRRKKKSAKSTAVRKPTVRKTGSTAQNGGTVRKSTPQHTSSRSSSGRSASSGANAKSRSGAGRKTTAKNNISTRKR